MAGVPGTMRGPGFAPMSRTNSHPFVTSRSRISTAPSSVPAQQLQIAASFGSPRAYVPVIPLSVRSLPVCAFRPVAAAPTSSALPRQPIPAPTPSAPPRQSTTAVAAAPAARQVSSDAGLQNRPLAATDPITSKRAIPKDSASKKRGLHADRLEHPEHSEQYNKHMYHQDKADEPCGVKARHMLLGARLATLAYSDDEPGTVLAYKDNPVLSGTFSAIAEIAGGEDEATRPLSELLGRVGFTADSVFSINEMVDGQLVDTQGYIAHSPSEIALVFRGTTGVTDWITNMGAARSYFDPFDDDDDDDDDDEEEVSDNIWGRLRSWLRGSRRPCCHRGFYKALMAAAPLIDEFILPALQAHEPKRLIIAGHSLGGAIANGALGYILTAVEFGETPHTLLYVTIGQPRFGSKEYCDWLDEKLADLEDIGREQGVDKIEVARIVNDEDMVPTVPPQLFGFGHMDHLVLLTKNGGGQCLVKPSVQDEKEAFEGHDHKLKHRINHHRPDKYIKHLVLIRDLYTAADQHKLRAIEYRESAEEFALEE